MTRVHHPGPCIVCGKFQDTSYRKQMCGNCYDQARRRERGLKPKGQAKFRFGPCSTCGSTTSSNGQFVRGLCNTCYKTAYNLEYRDKEYKPRSRHKGPCLNCGAKSKNNRYTRKLCQKCYARLRNGTRPVSKYNGPCCDCGIVDPAIKFVHKRCRKCHNWFYNNIKLGNTTQKALKSGTPVMLTEEQWQRVLEHFEYRCAYCDKDIRTNFTIDHVTPLSKGGTHTINNVVPCCKPCNSRKKDRPPLRPVATLKE